ncbi:UDP-N-acetylmuramoyl-L-alanyl-D-glutamate--2,6-diaminopimelate ligase [Patescibacteria group bacterium]|nr:UDP-N-acetylmuramoyl-L-alanyl-D-glutamate--2,6-diaminopimelate ligase [Patescibacteria group bacterium]MBU4512248.1 UDP-N-acetylmuramoyl-L-alanyl-D-glutamate--2,6-diaminopimelate ligase [Patescibacteria group bacterium]MCG2692666.1 UDP-N-acetylmuramoyl-L-alanyl-D-glutamate--2,6-diaminopimelate ligase [Candidatus Parcubacteria bacterium]
MKSLLKKLIPKPIIQSYHYILAQLAVFYYHHPSRKMIVIGVTGTKGKSTTSYLAAKILEGAGFKVGLSSTIMFKVGKREWLNDKKMTMIGRFALQRLLSQMTKAGCQYAVVETSSEGIAQYRHLGIDYDVLVFTGLAPEHIEAHGSFENYKGIKLSIFKDLESRGKKIVKFKNNDSSNSSNNCSSISNIVKRVIIANGESEYAKDFLNFNVDEKFTFQASSVKHQASIFQVSSLNADSQGISFKINNTQFNSSILGQFNIMNSLAAINVGLSQNIGLEKIKQALEKITTVPGRMEVVYNKNFKVIVDYAHEPHSMENVYKEVASWPHNKIIAVFGGTGGGRDKWRRPKMGELAAKYCDIIILTTDDPYQDDPAQIIQEIEKGIINNKSINNKLYKIVDRKQAIKKAIDLAQAGDIILVLGKGCEQKMALANGKYIDWDDRKIVKDIIDEF